MYIYQMTKLFVFVTITYFLASAIINRIVFRIRKPLLDNDNNLLKTIAELESKLEILEYKVKEYENNK